jgi:hypothetical protein
MMARVCLTFRALPRQSTKAHPKMRLVSPASPIDTEDPARDGDHDKFIRIVEVARNTFIP